MTWEDVKGYVRNAVASVTFFSTVSRTNANSRDEVSGRGPPDEPAYAVDVRRMGPFGFRSRPPIGTEALVLYVGNRGVMVAADSAQYGPSDVDQGEGVLYCVIAGTRIKLDKNGNILIDAAPGQNVIINGGALDVARRTDPINLGACYVKMAGGNVTGVFINGLALPVEADPAPPNRGTIAGPIGTRFKA